MTFISGPDLDIVVIYLHAKNEVNRSNGSKVIIRTTQTDRQTDRLTNRQTYRQTDKQTNRQTDRQTHKQTDSQTDTHTDRQTDRQTDTSETFTFLHLRAVMIKKDDLPKRLNPWSPGGSLWPKKWIYLPLSPSFNPWSPGGLFMVQKIDIASHISVF